MTAAEKVATLERKLTFWEGNLRANADHYAAEGRDVSDINRDLDFIEQVRDVVWPRCDMCGRTDYTARTKPGSAHRCETCRQVTR